MTSPILLGSLCAAVLAAGPAASSAPPSRAPASRLARETAFDVASAIRSDAKDRGQAQAGVLLDALMADDVALAARLAERVEGWQQGVVDAEIAAWYARAGDVPSARAWLARAETYRASVTGWQNPRISSHVATAAALLPDGTSGTGIDDLAREDRQYAGRARIVEALQRATAGDVSGAMAALAKASPADADLEVAWGRTAGYLELAKLRGLGDDQRLAALASGRKAADAIPGWSRAGMTHRIGEQYWKLERPEPAREAFTAAEELTRALPATMPVRAVLLAELAKSWARAGERDRAHGLLEAALSAVPVVQDIERPAAIAAVAAAHAATGDTAAASRRFDEALSAAEALVNARPRALAVVEVCRAMAREDVVPDERVRARLDHLRKGLKDPW